jgi:hypothetical protein
VLCLFILTGSLPDVPGLATGLTLISASPYFNTREELRGKKGSMCARRSFREISASPYFNTREELRGKKGSTDLFSVFSPSLPSFLVVRHDQIINKQVKDVVVIE